jgi:hypothetical protein
MENIKKLPVVEWSTASKELTPQTYLVFKWTCPDCACKNEHETVQVVGFVDVMCWDCKKFFNLKKFDKDHTQEPLTLFVVDSYRDGGTKLCRDKDNPEKKYYIDGRFKSETKGKIFDKYPGYKGAEMLDVEFRIEELK